MKSHSYSALTLGAIVVTLGSLAVSGYLVFENVGNRWAYLGAMCVLAAGWIVQHFSEDRRAVHSSILLAGLLLLVTMLEKLAQHGGWMMGADVDHRLLGVLLGAIVVALSNAVPKKAGSARSFATRRIIGWALVLGGLGFALAWLVLPLAIAGNVAIIALLLGLSAAVAAYTRSFVALIVIVLSCITAAQAQPRDVTGAAQSCRATALAQQPPRANHPGGLKSGMRADGIPRIGSTRFYSA